ncbi:MAG: hypothetical protein ACLSH6_07185 [Limosilactobacillus pontis]
MPTVNICQRSGAALWPAVSIICTFFTVLTIPSCGFTTDVARRLLLTGLAGAKYTGSRHAILCGYIFQTAFDNKHDALSAEYHQAPNAG